MPGATKEARAYSRALLEQGLKKCSTCKEIKPLDDFYNAFTGGSISGKTSRCKPCDHIYTTQIADRKRADLKVIKEAQGCMICGYNEDGSRLHFHHRDKSTKLFSIGDCWTMGRQRIQEEIDKCDILCTTCHTTHHNDHDKYHG
jgi:hypothetical protein